MMPARGAGAGARTLGPDWGRGYSRPRIRPEVADSDAWPLASAGEYEVGPRRGLALLRSETIFGPTRKRLVSGSETISNTARAMAAHGCRPE
jgi:hypothetical protein